MRGINRRVRGLPRTKFQSRREPRRWPADPSHREGPCARHGVLATRQLYKPLYRSLLVRSGPHINRWPRNRRRGGSNILRTWPENLSRSGVKGRRKIGLEHLLCPPPRRRCPRSPVSRILSKVESLNSNHWRVSRWANFSPRLSMETLFKGSWMNGIIFKFMSRFGLKENLKEVQRMKRKERKILSKNSFLSEC